MRPILWHIVISHYSEKARWALAHKGVDVEHRAPPPGMHIPVALWLTRGRGATLPILELDGERHGDSTAIIAALERRFPEPPLYPADPADCERALALEDWFDEELGPYIRRAVFHEIRRDAAVFQQVGALAAPEVFARLGRFAGAYGRALTGLRYAAGSERRAAEARDKVAAAVDRLEAELGDREYLVGDQFTVADLTAAALLYPMVLPPEGPRMPEHLPAGYEAIRDIMRGRRAWTWVEEMFRRHRAPTRAPAATAA
jgi:glutathione S-transferase